MSHYKKRKEGKTTEDGEVSTEVIYIVLTNQQQSRLNKLI